MLFVRHGQHLFERGQAQPRLVESGFAQRPHAFGLRLLRDLHRAAVAQDDALDLFRDGHDLVDADAALVAVVAGRATHRAVGHPGAVDVLFLVARLEQRFVGDVRGRLARRTQPAGQALRRDQDHARCDVEGRDAHVPHPRQRGGGIVGVQRGQHQVACLGRLDRDVRGFQVADFPHHDDVGILPQERLERRGEGQPGFLVHVDLVDAGQVDFRRVFRRRDVHPRLVQHVQAGVERHRLARARRPRHQDHPVGPADGMEQARLLLGLVAERIDAQLGAAGVEDTDHDLLAEQRGQRAHAEVDHPVRPHLELHAPVLGHALFRDVQAGDHLDARGQLLLDRDGRRCDLAQLAVDPEADSVLVLVRLEVQVGRTHVECVQQHLVQELDDGRVFDFCRGRVLGFGTLLRRQVVELEIPPRHHAFHGLGRGLGGRIHQPHQLVVLGDDPLHAHLGGELDLLRRLLVGGVRRRDDEPVVALAQHDDPVRLADLRVQHVARQAQRIDGLDVEQGGAEHRRHGMRQIDRGDRTRTGQLRDEAAAVDLGLPVDVLRHLLAQLPGRNQRPPQAGQSDTGSILEGVIGVSHVTRGVDRLESEPSYHRNRKAPWMAYPAIGGLAAIAQPLRTACVETTPQ